MHNSPKQAHRVRKMLLATGLTLSTALATGFAAADPITVVSWGGSYGAAQDAALFTDASKNSGIAIIRESGASMSKTCLQVESGCGLLGPGGDRFRRRGFCCGQGLPGKDRLQRR